jgi:hypothetical protein
MNCLSSGRAFVGTFAGVSTAKTLDATFFSTLELLLLADSRMAFVRVRALTTRCVESPTDSEKRSALLDIPRSGWPRLKESPRRGAESRASDAAGMWNPEARTAVVMVSR